MKKHLLITFFMGAVTVLAQPILNQSNSQPSIGTQINSVYGTFGGEELDITGEDVIWDYSSLSGSNLVLDLVSLGSTPYSVSGATLCVDYGNYYDYYAVNSSVFERKAIYFSSNTYYNFSNGQSLVEFPCTYLTNFEDTYTINGNLSGDILLRNGATDSNADGYGTLILPWGSIENVLRH